MVSRPYLLIYHIIRGVLSGKGGILYTSFPVELTLSLSLSLNWNIRQHQFLGEGSLLSKTYLFLPLQL